jgi:hypothetical protein
MTPLEWRTVPLPRDAAALVPGFRKGRSESAAPPRRAGYARRTRSPEFPR